MHSPFQLKQIPGLARGSLRSISADLPIIAPKLVARVPAPCGAAARPGGGLGARRAGRERCRSFPSRHCPLFLAALRTCTLCLELTEVLRFQAVRSWEYRLLIRTARLLACAPAAPPWSQRTLGQRAGALHSAGAATAMQSQFLLLSPSPEKAALPATRSCSSTSETSSSSVHSSDADASESRWQQTAHSRVPLGSQRISREGEAGRNHLLTGRGWLPSQKRLNPSLWFPTHLPSRSIPLFSSSSSWAAAAREQPIGIEDSLSVTPSLRNTLCAFEILLVVKSSFNPLLEKHSMLSEFHISSCPPFCIKKSSNRAEYPHLGSLSWVTFSEKTKISQTAIS